MYYSTTGVVSSFLPIGIFNPYDLLFIAQHWKAPCGELSPEIIT